MLSKTLRFVLLALFLLAIASVVMGVWLDRAVRTTLAVQGEASSERWIRNLEQSVPDFASIMAAEKVTLEQLAFIDATMVGSDVFKVQLFDREGHKLFETNASPGWEPGEPNRRAADVLRSRTIDLTIEDGDAELGEPYRYVEAYMPVFDGFGTPIGVAELYVDVSFAAAALRQKLGSLTALAIMATALIVIIQAIAFIKQRGKLDKRETELRVLEERAEHMRLTLTSSIDALPHGFVLYDKQDRMVVCNEEYRKIYPLSAHAMVPGAKFEDILLEGLKAGEYRDAVGREDDWRQERLRRHKSADETVFQQLSDGKHLQIIERATPDGGRVGLRIDITDHVESRERAERAEQRLRDAIDALPAGFWLFDDQDRLIMFNEQYRDMFGASCDTFRIGDTYKEIIEAGLAVGQYPDAVGRESEWLEDVMQARARKSYELVYPLEDGRWIHSLNKRTSDGGIVGFRVDITELKKKQIELEGKAKRNALTGLLNRRGAQAAIEEMRTGLENGEQIAFLHIDLDRFKPLNDAFGHNFGDQLLKHVAGELSQNAPEVSAVARIGGDEFLIAYVLSETAEEPTLVAERLRSAIAEPLHLQGQYVHVGASVGIATWSPVTPASIEDAIQNADIALYTAKTRGKNAVASFEPDMRKASVESARIAEDVARGLEKGEFTAHFQPVISAETSCIEGFEALARWQHETRGLLTPADFIDASDLAGHTTSIDRVVLEEAISLAKSLRNLGRADLRISLNLSSNHLKAPDVVDQYIWLLEANGIAPQQFRIEILESTLLDERSSHLVETTARFRAAGFAIDLDDFGTGHTAIASLRSFDVDRIKIDRSLVAGIHRDAELAILTDAIVALGRRLGLSVLAEGVEQEEEVAMLKDIGCTCFQGFYFAYPMSAAKCLEAIGKSGVLGNREKSGTSK